MGSPRERKNLNQMSNQWNLFTFNFLAITRWFCDKYDKLAALKKVVVDTACVVLPSYFNKVINKLRHFFMVFNT